MVACVDDTATGGLPRGDEADHLGSQVVRERVRAALGDFRVRLGLVVVGALVVRVWAILAWSRWMNPEGDQQFYLRQSQYLADGFGFVYRHSQTGELFPTAQHPPLHSIYLGLVTFLGGDRMQGDSHVYHRLACAVLGAATVVVVALVARRLAGDRAGLVAAALAAIYPNLWINDAMFVSESTYALMIALTVLAAYELWDEPDLRRAAALGAVTAFATLARAEAQILFLFLVPPLLLAGRVRREHPLRHRLGLLAVAWAAGLAVLAPWLVRNLTIFEHPALVSSGAGFVLEVANCDQTYGLAPTRDLAGNIIHADPTTFLGYWADDCDRFRGGKPWPEGDETVVERVKRQHGIDYILAHKERFPVVVAARIGRMWDVWRPGQSVQLNTFFERRGEQSTIAGMALYYPMLGASIAALVALRRRGTTITPFIALAAMVTVTAGMSFGITRYRVGVDVVLCVLSGVLVGLLWPSPRASDRGHRRASRPEGDRQAAGAGSGS